MVKKTKTQAQKTQNSRNFCPKLKILQLFTLHPSNFISSAIISACVVRSIDWKAPCICPQKPLEKSFSNEFRLKFPQPIKNLRPLNPESTIYRTPTSVSASEVPKSRPASKYQFSKYRPCCISSGS